MDTNYQEKTTIICVIVVRHVQSKTGTTVRSMYHKMARQLWHPSHTSDEGRLTSQRYQCFCLFVLDRVVGLIACPPGRLVREVLLETRFTQRADTDENI